MTDPDRRFLSAWLRRLGLDELPPANADGLALLVRRQQETIPFENVDVLCGMVPRLDRASLEEKLLDRRRGGYCLEQNSLLAYGLALTGFSVRHVLARVHWKREAPGPRTHHFLDVEIDGQPWIADAGFGGPGLIVPMQLAVGSTALQNGATYRLMSDSHNGMQLSRQSDCGPETSLYAWTNEPVGAPDLDAANWLAATWPGSPFGARLMTSRHTAGGRITLDNSLFTRHAQDAAPETVDLGSCVRVLDYLASEFGISLEPDERTTLSRRLKQILPQHR